ncbi:hypothetical protein H7698_03145 [Pseudomonas sp. p50]|uniref:hypothetical protein n=1 Tax=Pseudomonas sp. p50(2008) TaxID=2816832 RepID=UPI00188A372D|nr:hypothetical protein [Pseudomonas sp. p50(2008)]MBF4555053.1 hypothetical protein [Pseudomonas sp. p50(2008)]
MDARLALSPSAKDVLISRRDAQVLLEWINQTELEGVVVQSLTLDERDQRLEAQRVVQSAADL